MLAAHEPSGAVAKNESSADNFLHLIRLATGLLLEYSARTEMTRRQISRVAQHLGIHVSLSTSYRQATIFIEGREASYVQVPELRLNVAVNVATLRAIDELCADRLNVEQAIERLEAAGSRSPEYGRWTLALIFGAGASALAWILGGDWGAIVVSGVASALGLIARKALGKRHTVFFVLPFVAALIGSLLGGIAIRLEWTHTQALCLVVPALMLVPGPHLIMSVQEMLENNMNAAVARLGLAITILIAASLGCILGIAVTLGTTELLVTSSPVMRMNLLIDVVLAGLAASAFGAFYNTPRRVLWVAILCGMVGHGVRFAAMEQGMTQSPATLLGCFVIGVAAMVTADRFRLPFAAVAFAGAVSMMPGVFVYESFSAATAIAVAGRGADPALVAGALALVIKAVFVIGAMAIGLLVGAWTGSRLNQLSL